MNRSFEVAEVSFKIEYSNHELNQSFVRLVPFVIEDNHNYEARFLVEEHELDLSAHEGQTIFRNHYLEVKQDQEYYTYVHHVDDMVYAIVREKDSSFRIELSPEKAEIRGHEYYLIDLMHLERTLIKKRRIVFHSCFIEYKGKAILFIARSGGGKSTQGDLWKKYKGARIINGDKCAVGLSDGKWIAYGIPFSGSSEYYLNEKYPIDAIVIVNKAPYNEAFRVNGMQAFPFVMRQTIMNPWDQEFCDNVLEICGRMSEEIPIYLLNCTKEKDAVDVLAGLLDPVL